MHGDGQSNSPTILYIPRPLTSQIPSVSPDLLLIPYCPLSALLFDLFTNVTVTRSGCWFLSQDDANASRQKKDGEAAWKAQVLIFRVLMVLMLYCSLFKFWMKIFKNRGILFCDVFI